MTEPGWFFTGMDIIEAVAALAVGRITVFFALMMGGEQLFPVR
jgi:hypothetical protein